MEVRDAKTSFVVANTTNTRAPAFTVTGLRPGTGYWVSISSNNAKGMYISTVDVIYSIIFLFIFFGKCKIVLYSAIPNKRAGTIFFGFFSIKIIK